MAVLAGALIWSAVQAGHIPSHFQRALLPTVTSTTSADGKAETDNGLRAARDTAAALNETLAGACERGTIYSVTQPCSATVEDGGSVSTELVGIENGYYGIRNFTLYCGRLIYPDELTRAERVAMIDERLAVALFKYAEPLGRSVTVKGQSYEIIGILRSSRKAGDRQEHSMYVPYRALERGGHPVTTLVYEAVPVKGAGGWSGFEAAVKTFGERGTTISLVKEKMNATMPQRVLVCVLGFIIGAMLIRRVTFHVKHTALWYKEELKNTYASRLVWRALPRALALAVGYAACAAVLAGVFVWIIEPVYTFPEWVPAVLVEPEDISKAFWNVWQQQAEAVVIRTKEAARLGFLRELSFWCSLILGIEAARMLPYSISTGKSESINGSSPPLS